MMQLCTIICSFTSLMLNNFYGQVSIIMFQFTSGSTLIRYFVAVDDLQTLLQIISYFLFLPKSIKASSNEARLGADATTRFCSQRRFDTLGFLGSVYRLKLYRLSALSDMSRTGKHITILLTYVNRKTITSTL